MLEKNQELELLIDESENGFYRAFETQGVIGKGIVKAIYYAPSKTEKEVVISDIQAQGYSISDYCKWGIMDTKRVGHAEKIVEWFKMAKGIRRERKTPQVELGSSPDR